MIDGASLLPILGGKPIRRTTPLYWQYDLALGWAKAALRDGDWKLLADEKLAKFELYNLKDDVFEKHDLAAAKPERVKTMSDTLARLHAEIKSEGPTWPEGKRGEK
ncbi:MAG: hypothetical protein NTW96_18730 [Planctomycetia bacterium]|nr:hypothetical protein [Planctomycetia bacterium]